MSRRTPGQPSGGPGDPRMAEPSDKEYARIAVAYGRVAVTLIVTGVAILALAIIAR